MTKTPTMAVQSGNGRYFAVRFLPVGARYGRDNALTIDDKDTVEFYDLTYADDGGRFLGQFVSRYHAATLLGEDNSTQFGRTLREYGLCLDGGNRHVWTIDGPSMAVILSWLRRTRAEVSAPCSQSSDVRS